MNDFDKLASLLEEMGVPFEADCEGPEWYIGHGWDDCGHRVMGVEDHSHDAIRGYPGFYTKYAFDTNGNFLYVGAWE